MGNSKRLWQALAGVDVLVGCFVLSGCDWRESGAGEGSEPVELRVYRVPVERQDELFGMLRQALGVESATKSPGRQGLNGSLLVTAPARIHEGLEEVLSADLGAAPVVRPVTLTYWFLVGRPFNPAEGNPPFAVAGQQVPVLELSLGKSQTPRVRLSSLSWNSFSCLPWITSTRSPRADSVDTSSPRD